MIPRMWVATLLAMGTIVSSAWGQQPSISQDILPVVKSRGQTAKMQCYVDFPRDNPDSYKVKWVFDPLSLGISISSNQRISLDFNPLTDGKQKYEIKRDKKTSSGSNTYIFTLTIHGLVQSDTGDYACQIIIPGNRNHPNKKGLLKVSVPPSILPQSTVSINAEVGQRVSLTCVAEGDPRPTIEWIKVTGDHQQLGDNFTVVETPIGKNQVRSVITLPRVANRDRGVHRCHASNDVQPPDTHDAVLHIEYKPTARTEQRQTEGYVNKKVQLECILSGSPEPEMIWAFVGKKIPTKDFYSINRLYNGANYILAKSKRGTFLKAGESYHSLTIRKVSANDFGYYVCRGINRYGYSQAYIELFEVDQSSYNVLDPVRNEVIEGASVRPLSSVYLILSAILLCLVKTA